MDREIKKSGINLSAAGVLGVLFFWLTDPVYGVGQKTADAAVVNPIDAMNEASMGTIAGIAGSLTVLLLGLWMMTRRTT